MPISGSLFSSSDYVKSYVNITSGSAISGGFWETVYDGSPTSTSSSALVDLTYGHSTGSLLAGYSEVFLNDEKQRIYKLMAQRLLGSKDSLFTFNETVAHELFFVSFKRRIYKDEIKKASVTVSLQMSGAVNDVLALTDAGAGSSFTIDAAGDQADLFSGSTAIGKVYYNAGMAVFTTGAFIAPTASKEMYWSGSSNSDLPQVAVTGTIDNMVDGLRNRLNEVQIHNQTNLHSTFYFCRALNSDFNYSTNPTFVDSDGRIVVTSGTDNTTRTYISSIGLYDINDNLLAVAKTSEPVKKSPDSEVTLRIKLSF